MQQKIFPFLHNAADSGRKVDAANCSIFFVAKKMPHFVSALFLIPCLLTEAPVPRLFVLSSYGKGKFCKIQEPAFLQDEAIRAICFLEG